MARAHAENMAALLKRMKSGDRVAAAEFIADHAARIRRRFRGKLGPDVRRLFDSQDLVSTVSRRLDAIIIKHALAAESAAELWSLIGALASHSIAEYTDKALKHRTFGGAALAAAPAVVEPKPSDNGSGPRGNEIIGRCLALLEPGEDRAILRLRANGRTHMEIAEELGTNPTAVRKRWQRIRDVLRALRG
jgi:DNA-directed RNA polymerase specialized sigma24 family protein